MPRSFSMLEGEDNLIREAQSGQAQAFDALYSHYLSPIYRFIYMKVTHREEAEDLTHEVFLSAWQNIGSFKPQGFPFSSWLYQIARNRVIDHYRLKKPQVELEAAEGKEEFVRGAAQIENRLEQELSLEKIKAALRRLSHDQQDVLLMRFMEDLSHQEIAAAFGKSEGAVRLIQHRAVKELKKLLNDQGILS